MGLYSIMYGTVGAYTYQEHNVDKKNHKRV